MVIVSGQVAGRPHRRDPANWQNKGGGFMSKTLFAVFLAAGLFAAPLPALMQNAAAQTTSPDKKQVKTKKPPTPGQLAARERLGKCAAEWKEAKAAGKIEKGMKWLKYWSACNKRLKTAS
jgi:hypothetical protein